MVSAVLVGGAVIVAAGVQAATGIGFALVLAPVLLALLSPAGAVVTLTLLGLELNLLVLLAERRPRAVAWREVAPVVVGALPGSFAGALLLRVLSRPPLQIAVGLLVMGGVLARVWLLRTPREPEAQGTAMLPAAGVGLATGALATSSGISGPPLALWFAHRGMGPARLRDSLSASFLGLGVAGAVSLLPLLGRARLTTATLVIAAGCVLAGHAAGSRVFARLAPERYEPLLMAVVLATGVASLAGGLSAL